MSNVPIWNGSLKEWRKAMGLTQPQAAEKLDCGPRRIQGIERGESGYRLNRPDLVYMAVEIEAAALKEYSRRIEMVSNCHEC